MMYSVVYQYDTTFRGFFGLRFHSKYKSRQDFEKDPHPNQIVIAQGISYQEAEDLTALTPEICRYIEAIEIFFTSYPNPNSTNLTAKFKSIRENTIFSDRKTIFSRNLERVDAKPFIQHFKKMAEASPESTKSFAIRWALATITDEDTGEVI